MESPARLRGKLSDLGRQISQLQDEIEATGPERTEDQAHDSNPSHPSAVIQRYMEVLNITPEMLEQDPTLLDVIAATIIARVGRGWVAKHNVARLAQERRAKLQAEFDEELREVSLVQVQSLARKRSAVKLAEARKRERAAGAKASPCAAASHQLPPLANEPLRQAGPRHPAPPSGDVWESVSLGQGRPSTVLFRFRHRPFGGRGLCIIFEGVVDQAKRAAALMYYGRQPRPFSGIRALFETILAKKSEDPTAYPLMTLKKWDAPSEATRPSSREYDFYEKDAGALIEQIVPTKQEQQFSAAPMRRLINRSDASNIHEILEFSRRQLASLKGRLKDAAKLRAALRLDPSSGGSGARPAQLTVTNLNNSLSRQQLPSDVPRPPPDKALSVPHRTLIAKQVTPPRKLSRADPSSPVVADAASRQVRPPQPQKNRRQDPEKLLLPIDWSKMALSQSNSAGAGLKLPSLQSGYKSRGPFEPSLGPRDDDEARLIAQQKGEYLREVIRHHDARARTMVKDARRAFR